MAAYFLLCPVCGAKVPLPDDEFDDPFKVTECAECDACFDYDPEEVQQEPPDRENDQERSGLRGDENSEPAPEQTKGVPK